MQNVVMYTTPTCVYCKKTKEFFSQHKVAFVEHDVAFDEAHRNEMIEKTGQMGVPVILIDQEIVVGFDKSRLAKLLGITE